MQAVFDHDSSLVVWWATECECVSAIARMERESVLTAQRAQEALDRLDSLRASWEEVEPVDTVRRTARRILRVHPIRAADAYQIAAALVASEGHAQTLTFVTLDERQRLVAEREGFALAEL